MGEVVVVGGEKGGTGKTTVAVNIAIMSAIQGKDTLYVDADNQGSGKKFFERRNENNDLTQLTSVGILGKHLNQEINRLAAKYDRIIIDCGGLDSVELRSALVSEAASIWVSPLQPTDFDLDTLTTLDELAEISSTYNPKLKAKILFNKCHTHSKIKTVDEAKEIVTDNFPHLSPLETSLGHRVVFQYSISNNQSVVEFEKKEYDKLPPYQAKKYPSKGGEEITSLYNNIFVDQFKPLIQPPANSEKKEEECV